MLLVVYKNACRSLIVKSCDALVQLRFPVRPRRAEMVLMVESHRFDAELLLPDTAPGVVYTLSSSVSSCTEAGTWAAGVEEAAAPGSSDDLRAAETCDSGRLAVRSEISVRSSMVDRPGSESEPVEEECCVTS